MLDQYVIWVWITGRMSFLQMKCLLKSIKQERHSIGFGARQMRSFILIVLPIENTKQELCHEQAIGCRSAGFALLGQPIKTKGEFACKLELAYNSSQPQH